MSSENMTDTEVTTEVEVTTPDVTPAENTEIQETQSTEAAESGTETPATPPPYMANYKFKAAGKEHEFEDWAKSLVKDPDTEAKMRKVFEKAYGMDSIKERHEKLNDSYRKATEYYQTLDKTVQQVEHFVKTKDLDNLFGNAGLGLEFNDIVEWMNRKLELMQMPADQRQAIEQQAQVRQQNYMLQQQAATWEQRAQQQEANTRSIMLDSLLTRQDVASIAEKVDSTMGEVGAFRNLVIQEGQNEFFRTGRVLSVEEAVNAGLSKYGKFISQGSAQPSSSQPTEGVTAPAGTMAAKKPTPIIPHIAGRNSSPVSKKFKTLDDIKAYAKTLED